MRVGATALIALWVAWRTTAPHPTITAISNSSSGSLAINLARYSRRRRQGASLPAAGGRSPSAISAHVAAVRQRSSVNTVIDRRPIAESVQTHRLRDGARGNTSDPDGRLSRHSHKRPNDRI